ncbi:MAG: hypothetical protein LQ343_001127 [Gyalolechia ehrenbergii]|nr:MAG: hypothetical protein LQ343_001127 [Gyalolechia ehrenbergii]
MADRSPVRKRKRSGGIPEVTDSEFKCQAQQIALPTIPASANSPFASSQPQHDASGEHLQQPTAPSSELGAQGLSQDNVLPGATQSSSEIPTSGHPAIPPPENEPENSGDPWADPDSFPLVVYYGGPHFMMANSRWTLDQLRSEILRNLRAQGVDCTRFDHHGIGNLTVHWERSLLLHMDPNAYPASAFITAYNVRVVLEFLKWRTRSDFVLVADDGMDFTPG